MAKREAEIQFIDQAAHDAETVRLVREWAKAKCGGDRISAYQIGIAHAAEEVLCILDGNEWVLNALDLDCNPAAKARTRAGGK
jgi:hypothetical protein